MDKKKNNNKNKQKKILIRIIIIFHLHPGHNVDTLQSNHTAEAGAAQKQERCKPGKSINQSISICLSVYQYVNAL